MQSIDTSGLSELRRTFQQARQSIPQLQRAAHERLGQVVQRTVRGNISTSLNDSHGKIASWQDVFVGSGGGYVAVRAGNISYGPEWCRCCYKLPRKRSCEKAKKNVCSQANQKCANYSCPGR